MENDKNASKQLYTYIDSNLGYMYMYRNFKMAWKVNIKQNKKMELRFHRGDQIKIFFFQGNSMNLMNGLVYNGDMEFLTSCPFFTLCTLEIPIQVVWQTVRTQMKCCRMLHFIRACTVKLLRLKQSSDKFSQDMIFPTMWYVRPAKFQISLRIRAV